MTRFRPVSSLWKAQGSTDRGVRVVVARKSAILVILVIAAMIGWQRFVSWQTAEHNAERLVSALTRAMEFQMDSNFRAIESLLTDAARRIDPDEWPRSDLVDWYADRLKSFPEASSLLVFDRRGRLANGVVTSSGFIEIAFDSSALDYVQKHLAAPRRGVIVIGRPLVGRFSKRPLVPFSMPILDGSGRLKGVVTIGLDSENLLKMLSSMMIEDAGGISLMSTEGVFLVRLPNPDGMIGQSAAKGALFRDHLSRSDHGVAHVRSIADGNEKIIDYGRLEHFPVFATVGMTKRTAFAEFWQDTIWIVGSSLGLSILLFIFAARSDRHEAEVEAALAESRTSELRLSAANETLSTQAEELRTQTEDLSLQSTELVNANAELARSNAELEQFAYVASHDLREPLRMISSYVDLVSRRYGASLDKDAVEFLGFARDGAQRMDTLIVDLLDYSRIDRKGEPIVPMALRDGLEPALRYLSVAIETCGATVTIDDIPADLMILGDRSQIIRLFQNLIGNAVKYHDPERPPRVEIGWKPAGEEIEFWVSDNGIGIEEQYFERIFGIFQRLHSREKYEGTGIGLAVCKKIVERHGGRIWLESTPDIGTIFHFTLMAAEPPQPVMPAAGKD
ncbi:sensor histidine kinase [Magnetospirillum fulvum]|uniref:histidine kinase n=1 Tax=Magnetospirillum fulvum TaxID=1082 RepID=A0A1H6HGU0_MAGFU|nr:sensor histidine kinase [Magnetospirillum fulvum]SEH34981.1 His Kinase A (phospho-acceptor) domain-containing protein [Magnetospirillum fulvum]